ncbi:hypothetical protein CGC20_23625 [Leishmania donovani]|uniref:Uncharacterized protein n=1 Tax=Leishmania donovani TaxID=5661 RepID=A0A504X5H6_LEIDO|nr:hypothetical protein CGC20_23625 [Leishmania donovani]
MALCVRRLVLAATLAAVVALLPCTSSAPVARAAGRDDFNDQQRKNTVAVLQAFARAIPDLGKKWKGDDLCGWDYVKCFSTTAGVWLERVNYIGTLPEMPAGVDYRHVRITQLHLSAMHLGLSGTLPASWSSMTSLVSLWLERCERVTGTLPASWSSMKALRDLNLHGAKVSGTLPPQWSSMTSVAILYLGLTKISGTLPPQWSSMRSLNVLDLQGTKVSGTLPPQWSSLRSLTLFDMEGTQVSGTLPPQWRSMRSMNVLDLQGTKVSGTLPPQWSVMKKAKVLQLQNCDLSGSLPSSWSAMPKLAKVLLSGNHFCGCVPESWARKAGLNVSIEDKHKGSNCIAGADCTTTAAPETTTTTPTLAPETECEVDGCEVCEGDSAARCARCREGYFLTSEKTCRANGDGGVAAAEDSTDMSSCALCCEALVSVPSLPCRRSRAATTAVTLLRRTVPPDADAGPAELTSAAAASCRDAEACATTGDADALLLPAPRLDRPAVGWAPLPWRRAMGAGVVRLPHPRHGRALLCFVVRDRVVCAVARPRTPTLPCPAYASSSLLWEVRAHAPPSGFARSWLVKGRAVPSTSRHRHRCWLRGRGAGGEDWRSPRSACARLTAELSAWSGADGTHVGCGGPHGWTADPRSRPAASSMCSATPHGWAGWARAAAARPLLLRGCVGVPESDGVLRRLCEAREVGGSVSAQTASCDAPADSRHAVHHRPSESVAYVPVRLHAALAVACGLADPAAAPACSPTAAAKPRTEGGAPWAWRGRTTVLAIAARRTACAAGVAEGIAAVAATGTSAREQAQQHAWSCCPCCCLEPCLMLAPTATHLATALPLIVIGFMEVLVPRLTALRTRTHARLPSTGPRRAAPCLVMLRCAPSKLFRATPLLRVWAAEEDDASAPRTTFRNVSPGRLLRLWRQMRQRAWILYAWDEEWVSPMQEGYLHQQRLEQVCFAPLSAYGMVPGSYCDPLLYNTKSTSPFRWHVANVQGDIVGHWYMDADELFRIKDWQPRNPDDPLEMFPRPPQMLLRWDESVDEHGNRAFRYRYDYDMMGPTGKWEAYPRYPFSHLYHGGPDQHGRAEGYGFQQGHLLRCDEAEEEEPWSYPGKIRPRDFEGAVERAKARFRERVRHGKETDPSEDPEYDLAQASEYVEPRDGRRAEWRHLWASGRKPGESLPFQVTFNDGLCFEENEGGPPAHPAAHYEATPKGAPHGRYEDADAAAARAAEAAHKAACEQSLSEAMERHRRLFGDTSGEPSGPRAPLPTAEACAAGGAFLSAPRTPHTGCGELEDSVAGAWSDGGLCRPPGQLLARVCAGALDERWQYVPAARVHSAWLRHQRVPCALGVRRPQPRMTRRSRVGGGGTGAL